MFCRTVSWDAAQPALCSRASLWCEVARNYQNGCPACRPRAHRPSQSLRRGIWLTTFAAPVLQEVEDDFGVHRVDPWSVGAVL